MKLKLLLQAIVLVSLFYGQLAQAQKKQGPNVVFIIVDQWRAQSTGFNGDRDAITPHIDQIATKSINLKNAVSGLPVCTPYRAQLMSGQYPLTNGVFMNDLMLDTNMTTLAKVYKQNGYETAFIGKWHIDGHGRESYIPATRHQGFDYWKTLECTHNYNKSYYYAGNSEEKLLWDGYDAIAQSKDANNYIKEHATGKKPFILFVSLGPPHDPYQTAPQKYKDLYKSKVLHLRPNIPDSIRAKIIIATRGYYAHLSALDDCIGSIWEQIQVCGIGKNTIFVFTSDHGDLLGSHGQMNKQQPYNESLKIPFLISYPKTFGEQGRESQVILNSPDIMPTLLGLSKLKIPATVEGSDLSAVLAGIKKDTVKATLISCIQPFGQWSRDKGGKEFRGVYTKQYTYVKDLKGPWLLFDNLADPFQLKNLVNNQRYQTIQANLDKELNKLLKLRHDTFKPGMDYVKQWKYTVDETETIPYMNINFEGKPIKSDD